jgi:LysM repeat protein
MPPVRTRGIRQFTTAISAVLLAGAGAGAAQAATTHPAGPGQPAHSGWGALHDSRPVIHPQTAALAAQAAYTVRPGDTLTAIAQRTYHAAADWPAIFWANQAAIRYANVIRVGQHLLLPATAGPVRPVPAGRIAPPAPVTTTAYRSPYPRSYRYTPARTPAYVPAAASVSTAGDSSFEACVIARESGGNPDVWNDTGHWGLFQFSKPTWEAYGGSGNDFGSASAAEQYQVFDNAIARGGEDNWAPYDGC